jgi:hypothetical protein
MSHRIGNDKEFDKRWRKNREKNKLARTSRRKNKQRKRK